jgi:hypothetical protein
MQRRGKRSNRPIDLTLSEMEQHCQLNADCNLLCARNGETWIQVSSLDELPMNLQTEYKNCQQEKRNRIMRASQEDTEEYNYEADEASRQQRKKHPKYIMQKIEDQFSNLMAPNKEEPLEFPTQLTSEEKRDKAAFEQPVVLTESRTRGKRCVDDKITYTLIRNKLMVNGIGQTATIVANQKLEHIRAALKHLMNIPDVKFVKLLGVGAYGLAFTICNPSLSSELFVVKYQYNQENKNSDELFVREYEMQKKFYDAGIAPEPKFFELSPNLIVMAKIDGTLDGLLEKPCTKETLDGILEGILGLISRMCANELSHRDLHWGNVGYVFKFEEEQFDTPDINLHPLQRRTDFQLIDFDSAKNLGCDPEAELTQLIRTSFPLISADLDQDNMTYLREELIQLYMNNYEYDPTQINNFSYWEARHRINFFELPEAPSQREQSEINKQSFSQSGSELEHKGSVGSFNDSDNDSDEEEKQIPQIVPSMPNMEPPNSEGLWEEPPMEWDEQVNPSLSGWFEQQRQQR